MKIYTLTGIQEDLNRSTTRKFGFKATQKEVIDALKADHGGFTEGVLRYFVIEEYLDGFYVQATNELWFEAVAPDKFKCITKPSQVKGLKNWWMS